MPCSLRSSLVTPTLSIRRGPPSPSRSKGPASPGWSGVSRCADLPRIARSAYLYGRLTNVEMDFANMTAARNGVNRVDNLSDRAERLCSGQPVPVGVGRRLGAAARARLAVDVGDVPRDRSLAQHQLLRDVAVAPAGRHQPQDLHFACSETIGVRARSWRGLEELFDTPQERGEVPLEGIEVVAVSLSPTRRSVSVPPAPSTGPVSPSGCPLPLPEDLCGLGACSSPGWAPGGGAAAH